jgi:hypothetical protein
MTQIMLKAVAALRNHSPDVYNLSPECSEGHPAVWKAQLESHGLWPFECAVQSYNLSGLIDALKTLEIPEYVSNCGCKGFTPRLPQDLCDIVCQTLESVWTTRTFGNASTHAGRRWGKTSMCCLDID